MANCTQLKRKLAAESGLNSNGSGSKRKPEPQLTAVYGPKCSGDSVTAPFEAYGSQDFAERVGEAFYGVGDEKRDGKKEDAEESRSEKVAGKSDQTSGVESFFSLPLSVKKLLKEQRNIDQLYEWQETLMTKLNAHSKNVIYCVPTSGGKTLVAELLIMKELFVHRKDVLLVLPFISIVNEKVKSLTPFAHELNFMVEEYAGPKGSVPPRKRLKYRSVYVATIEKAHLLITSLMEEKRLEEIGLIVVDELHMIGDGSSRGATLETLIVKAKLASARNKLNIRFLGMSATLNNLPDLAKFLNADIESSNFRPVALKEYVKCGRYLYDVSKESSFWSRESSKIDRTLNVRSDPNDTEDLRLLVEEVSPENSCLMFCSTKKHCENIALMLSQTLPKELTKRKTQEKKDMMKAMYAANDGSFCQVLRRTLPFGIAYHHSGLTSDEREAIETAYLKGIITCICCTSTLAAGVNLPAQRVIIRTPYVGNTFLSNAQYKQMCGRAGRAGFDASFGESILIVSNQSDKDKVMSLLKSPVTNCYSSLKENGEKGLATFILTLFYLRLAADMSQVEQIVLKDTLYGVQFGNDGNIAELLTRSHRKLLDVGLVRETQEGLLEVTPLGKGVIKGLIDIDKCTRIYHQLKECLNAVSLSNHLNLIYVTTLIYDEAEIPIYPDASHFFESFMKLTDSEHKSASVIGVRPGVVTRYRQTGIADEKIRRFYLTMIVYDVWQNKTDFSLLSQRYNIQRGTLQNLFNQIASNANSLQRFVGEMPEEFFAFCDLLPKVCMRFTYCCVPELIPLMELPAVKVSRAKKLFSAGFKNINDIAKASPQELTIKIENLPKNQASRMITAAKHILRGKADELQEAANELTILTCGSQSSSTASSSP